MAQLNEQRPPQLVTCLRKDSKRPVSLRLGILQSGYVFYLELGVNNGTHLFIELVFLQVES